MSLSNGQEAVLAARARLLEQLSAEQGWLVGDPDDEIVSWLPSALVTHFSATAGGPNTPTLGVLRIATPVTTYSDQVAAQRWCNELNLYATTSRWTLEAERAGVPPHLEVSCAFVLGAQSARELAPFVFSCAREQIAIAAAKVTGEIADLVQGDPLVYEGPSGTVRSMDDWNRVVYHYDDIVAPNRDRSSEPLQHGMRLAFERLRDQMLQEGPAAWFGNADDEGLTCEMPFTWQHYPDGIIGAASARPEEHVPPTVLMRSQRDGHPHIGNGLLITVQQPTVTDGQRMGDILSNLNWLDREYEGSTHSIGAWVDHDGDPQWVMYLPNALAYGDDDCDLIASCRHILLTATRQALLARRVLLPPDQLDAGENSMPVGLAAGDVTHGLAWGETGEGCRIPPSAP